VAAKATACRVILEIYRYIVYLIMHMQPREGVCLPARELRAKGVRQGAFCRFSAGHKPCDGSWAAMRPGGMAHR
jgi:hypothetical protein